MTFSFSSLSTFHICKHQFKLTYLGDEVIRLPNFFSDYGLFVHEVFEEYFNGNLSEDELGEYFHKNYDLKVTNSPPAFIKERPYIEQGQAFFNAWDFDLERFEPVIIEGTYSFKIGDTELTGRPDLVLHDLETGDYILVDYKTSAPFRVDKRNGSVIRDKKKMDDYYKQMYIYAYAVREEAGFSIDSISIIFPRLSRTETVNWTQEQEDETLDWVTQTITAIKEEEEFPPNTKSKFFCQQLCGVRDYCEYKPE